MDLSNVTVYEMSPEQWQYFMEDWIRGWSESLDIECDISPVDADEQAQDDWERYSGQEGWTMRDECIMERRLLNA
jgi:hypothetical protein